MSAAEQNPDHAGEQYTSLAATVARKTSYSEVADMPCVRKIRRAYSKPEHDDRTLVTCSAAKSGGGCAALSLARWAYRIRAPLS